jgi:hypothetical protein
VRAAAGVGAVRCIRGDCQATLQSGPLVLHYTVMHCIQPQTQGIGGGIGASVQGRDLQHKVTAPRRAAAERENSASGRGEVGWLPPGSRWQQREVYYVDRLAGLQGSEKKLLATAAQHDDVL